MRLTLIVAAVISAFWLFLFSFWAIKQAQKNAEKDRKMQYWKYNYEAMQKQFQEWRKQYEKMETGNTNNDFVASLDILHNGGKG